VTYDKWLASIPKDLATDSLWRMEVYRLAVFMADLAWHDVSKLIQDKRTISLADQLYRAVGSIGANIAEGYSRQSGKDQARFYEYGLGSTREARGWYYQSRLVLGDIVSAHRIRLLTRIAQMLLRVIPTQRGYKLAEEQAEYELDDPALLNNPPLP
jgi:four helix bundle protein